MAIEDKVLFDDEHIRITILPSNPECHEIQFKRGNTYLLQRGILRELSRTPEGEFKNKLNIVYPDIIACECHDHSVSVGSIGWSLMQAYMTELENERAYWIREYNNI